MWTFMILMSLFLETYSASSEDRCLSVRSYCPVEPEEYNKLNSAGIYSMPTNEEELNSNCRLFLTSIKCYEDYEKNCPLGDIVAFLVAFDFTMNVRLVRELCNTDSKLHTEYLKHVLCINSAIETKWNSCKNDSDMVSNEYYVHLHEKLEKGELNRENLREYFAYPKCLESIYTIICTLSQIEQVCSKEAAVVSREIVERSSLPLVGCHVKEFLTLKKGFLNFLSDNHELAAYLKDILNSPALEEFANNPRHAYVK